MKPKAYSYIRWSSERQTSGDSLKRQLELSEAYATEHGLELDNRLKDEGVSAYHGLNHTKGDLSIFLDQIRTGEVAPGSYLLVESLDRVSRENVIDAQTLFLQIINAGITVVTLLPHRTCVYSRETILRNPTDLILTIVEMIRAHEESAHKADRVAKAFASKRSDLETAKAKGRLHREIFTKNLPAWISIVDGEKVLNEKVKTVRRVFTLLAEGIGRHKVVQLLNAEKEPVLGPTGKQGWHPSHIHHLLHGKAVIGVFQPHRIIHENGRRKRVPIGDPVEGYFPAAIDEDLYHRAHAARVRNRMKVGRKGLRYNNLLRAGLAHCEVCNSHMNYQDKGQKSVPNYVCSAAVRGICSNTTKYRVSRIEEAILNHVSEVHATDIEPVENRAREIELAAKVRRRDELKAEQADAVKANLRNLRAVADHIAAMQEEEDRLNVEIAQLRQEIASSAVTPSITERLAFIASVKRSMKEGTDEEVYRRRARLADALRDVVTDVVFAPEGHVDLIVLNGIAAYRIEQGGVRTAKVKVGPGPGDAPIDAFIPPHAPPQDRIMLDKKIRDVVAG